MRIYEITHINKNIIILSGMDVEFSTQYNRIALSYKILQKVTGQLTAPVLHAYATELRNDITHFLEYEFYPDPDIDLLKKQAFEIYKKLDNFK